MRKSTVGEILTTHDSIISIADNFADSSFGFVMDAGSCLTKVVYRSKFDYSSGKSQMKAGQNQLRVVYFEVGEEKKMIQFLKTNCDFKTVYDAKVPPTVIMTGLRLSKIKTEIEKQLNINIEVIPDWTAIETFIKNISNFKLKCRKPSESSFHTCKFALEVVVSESVWEKKQKNGQDEKIKLVHGPAYELMISNRPREWLDNFMSHPGPPMGPALLINLGSSTKIGLIDINGDTSQIDFLDVGGETLRGMAKKMIGVKNFKKLMEMAFKGLISNVNFIVGDVRFGDSGFAADYFSSIPEGLSIMSMGKLVSSHRLSKKKYSNPDLAAGLVDMLANVIGKTAFLHARVHQLTTVYVSGTMANFEVIKRAVEGHFMANSIASNIVGQPFIRIFFLKNPAFIPALGLWQHNVDKSTKVYSSEYYQPQ